MSISEAQHLIDTLAADAVLLYADGEALRFRAPKGALSPEQRESLRARKSELLEVVRFRSLQGSGPPRVAGAEAVWAPTLGQTTVLTWPAPILIPDARLWSNPNLEACQKALNALIARHDILRTRYVRDQKQRLWGVTERERTIPIESIDLSALDETERRKRYADILYTRGITPFNFETGPLLRMSFIRLRAAQTVSLLVACHSVLDFISTEIFAREFRELYHGFDSGQHVELEPVPFSFYEHARAENEHLESDAGYRDYLYFHQRMLGRQLRFHLPTDASADTAHLIAAPAFGLVGGAELEALRMTARSSRVTPFVAALTATGIALSAWATSTDTFLWIIESGRRRPETTNLIGSYAFHSPFPRAYSPEETLREALCTTWQTYSQDMKHHIPAQYIAALTQRAYDNGLFVGVELNYMRIPAAEDEPDGLVLREDPCRPGEPREDTSIFHMRVLFYEYAGRIAWQIRYKGAAFTGSNVWRFSQLVGALLARMATEPDTKLADAISGAFPH